MLPGQTTLRVEVYLKELDRLVVNPDTEEAVLRRIPTGTTFVNEGRGHSRGIEIFLQKSSGRLTGWFTYGFNVTRWKNPLHEVNPTWYYPLQDQRHTVSLVAACQLSEHWSVGGKLQYHTGKPNTEIAGWAIEDNAEGQSLFVARYGDLNGARFPDYLKLDLRLSRDLRIFRMKGKVHLDLLNATNRKNLYIESYSAGDPPDALPEEKDIHGLPLLPYLGVDLRF